MTWKVRATLASGNRLRVTVDFFDEDDLRVAMNIFSFRQDMGRLAMEKEISRWGREWRRQQAELRRVYEKLPAGSTGTV